jgi:hypothetical protein
LPIRTTKGPRDVSPGPNCNVFSCACVYTLSSRSPLSLIQLPSDCGSSLRNFSPHSTHSAEYSPQSSTSSSFDLSTNIRKPQFGHSTVVVVFILSPPLAPDAPRPTLTAQRRRRLVASFRKLPRPARRCISDSFASVRPSSGVQGVTVFPYLALYLSPSI